MGGTKIGGKRAAATNIAKFGEDFYKEIGRKGGAKGHTGGFYGNRELARTAGAKGGRISKRPVNKVKVGTIAVKKSYDRGLPIPVAVYTKPKLTFIQRLRGVLHV